MRCIAYSSNQGVDQLWLKDEKAEAAECAVVEKAAAAQKATAEAPTFEGRPMAAPLCRQACSSSLSPRRNGERVWLAPDVRGWLAMACSAARHESALARAVGEVDSLLYPVLWLERGA